MTVVTPREGRSADTALFFIFFLAVVAVISLSLYKYWYKKDFVMLVETSCDSSLMSCYVRDCSIEGACPPNQFNEYRVFRIKGYEFAGCANDNCETACSEGSSSCEEITCDESNGDSCSVDLGTYEGE